MISVSRCLRLARSVEPGDFVSSSEPFGECLKTIEGENWTAAGFGFEEIAEASFDGGAWVAERERLAGGF